MTEYIKIFKRPDGSKVRLSFYFWRWSADFLFELRVTVQPPRKRGWYGFYSENDHQYRRMHNDQQMEFKKQELLKLVTEEELLEATQEAHTKLTPTKENLFKTTITVR